MRRNGSVPVLMFHSIRPREHIRANLSVPLEVFTGCMRALSQSGYRTASLHELYEHKSGRSQLPEKTVILTFDDGFLDNWTYVHPVLSYYSLKATVFPSIDFIGEGPPRETISYDGKLHDDYSDLEYEGSLRWSELRAMLSSGVFDVQSHTVTHDRYFSAPKIVGFTGDSRNYNWMAWNLYPGKKHQLLESSGGFIPDGLPVWEFGRALGVQRFFPDAELEREVIAALRSKIGENYCVDPNSVDLANTMVSDWSTKKGFPGRMETEQEYLQRAEYELRNSRETLENKLGKPVNFLCWPGGARTELALSVLRKNGYMASTAPSALRGRNKNKPGEDPSEIWRIGSCMKWAWRDRSGDVSPEHFIAVLDRYRGCMRGYIGNAMYKFFNVLKSSGR